MNRGRSAGWRSIAILLLSIDEELAASVLKNLRDDTLESVTRAMKEVQGEVVDARSLHEVFAEAYRRMRENRLAPLRRDLESLLVKALGPSRSADVSSRSSTDILVKKPFSVFESLPADDLADLLVEEHPQIAAVFLAHLERAKAAEVLKHMPADSHADLVQRVATLDRTPPDVVQGVLDVLSRKVKDLGLTTLRSEPRAWIKAAAEILNNLGGGDKDILDSIGETEHDIAAAIRDEMFTFDDLAALGRKAMQKVLSEVDTRALALSLKATTQEVEEAVFNNLSKRAAGMVAEERDSLGPTPLSEVREAQQEILAVVRDLIDKGELAVGASSGDELV